jgi:hypothetical protein
MKKRIKNEHLEELGIFKDDEDYFEEEIDKSISGFKR